MARYVVRTNPSVYASDLRPGDTIELSRHGRAHVIEGPFRSARGVKFRDVRGHEHVLRPDEIVRVVHRENPMSLLGRFKQAFASRGERLARELKDWTDRQGLRARGTAARDGSYVVHSPDIGRRQSDLNKLYSIAEKHGFEVFRQSSELYHLAPRSKSVRAPTQALAQDLASWADGRGIQPTMSMEKGREGRPGSLWLVVPQYHAGYASELRRIATRHGFSMRDDAYNLAYVFTPEAAFMNPTSVRSPTRVLVQDLQFWADESGVKPTFHLREGRPGVPGVLWMSFPGAGPSHERAMKRIADRHGFEVERDAAAFAFAPEAPFRNPGDRHTAVGKKFDDCVRSVRARGGAYSPEAVCAASLRRSGQGPALQRAAIAGRRRAARARHR